MTTQLEERLTRELSVGPSTITMAESNAFADQVLDQVDRRARQHRAVFSGTIAAFVAAISALAWSARTSLTVQTDGNTNPGSELANPGPATDAAIDPEPEVAGSSFEAALQSTEGVSTTTTIIAFLMLLGLPLLAAFVSWRRPANSSLSELARVGRTAITMLLTFFALVSFTGLLTALFSSSALVWSTNDPRNPDALADQTNPALISELHRWSWLALAILIVAAIIPWLLRFDMATIREAATRDSWGAVRMSVFLPIIFVTLGVTNQFSFLVHSGLAVIAMYWCFSRLPRLTALTRTRKVAFVVVAAVLTAISFLAFSYDVVYFATRSMEPTLEQHTRGTVNRLDTEVDRGDVITNLSTRVQDFYQVRRVIGVGGDVVAGRDGQLLVNGVVPDYFISVEDGGTRLDDFEEVRVPDDELFVMGDNYRGSSDSRQEGTISTGWVTGTLSEFDGG